MLMTRFIKRPNLPKTYQSAKKLADGSLEVDFIWDIPEVRCTPHGNYNFKPGSSEYQEIVREIGELKIGEEAWFDHGLTPEQEALLNSRDTPGDILGTPRNEE
jgi:hypothetical protein